MKKRIVLILIGLILFFGVFAAISAMIALKGVKSSKQAVAAFQNQDLDGAKKNLNDAKKQFELIQKTMIVFTPLRIIPLLGGYVGDAQRGVNAAVNCLNAGVNLIEAITPYADVLGLKGEGTFLGGTAQERLAKAVETISLVDPQLDEIGRDMAKVKKDVDGIAPWRYPNFLPGKPGDKIDRAKILVDQMESFIVDFRPLVQVLPEIMGQNGERKYLILFQNDKELRPTGGFITAYAIFRVNKGVIASEGSEDIYRLDDTLLKKIPAPEIIKKYLPGVSILNLRDSNLSPDFKKSMETFKELFDSTTANKKVDGIFALDTHFVLSLLEVLGPIDAYGTKFTKDIIEICNCPQIIYELERYADEPKAYERGSRKDIIGVLMQQMMDKAFKAPKSSWPKLVETGINNLREKHLLLYFLDQPNQEAVEKINFAGRLYNYDGDYLHINEANYAGAKSNLYVQEKVKQVIKKDKEGIAKKVTIEYKYPRRMDNCSLERKGGLCLAGIYRDFIRIYVPKGSKLVKSTGTNVAITASEDLEKTVFEGFFELRPEGTAKVELEYTVPLKLGKEYKLLIQKQPGTEGHTYEIDALGHKQRPFPLTTDKELIVKL